MGSLHHRRIKERTILEEGEINDFRDRMGACSLMCNLSRPPDSALTADLDPFAPLERGIVDTVPGYWLMDFPFPSVYKLFSSTGPGAGLKGGTAPDLAMHSHPLSYSGLRLSHILEISIYHVSPPGLSRIIRPPSIPYVPWIPIHEGRIVGGL